jgi:hypothetical protein
VGQCVLTCEESSKLRAVDHQSPRKNALDKRIHPSTRVHLRKDGCVMCAAGSAGCCDVCECEQQT